ncbi:MAG: PAS domain S-box protein [Bryobacteraceae bacterium]|jgi:PAS domain S-box-containing protein
MPGGSRQNGKFPLSPRAPYELVALFLVLVAAISAITYRYHLSGTEAIEREVRNQLATVADMKVKQITKILEDRTGDLRVILADRMSLNVMQRFLAGQGSPSDRAAIADWLEALRKNGPYANAVLSDIRGQTMLSVGRVLSKAERIREVVQETARQDGIRLRDFHRDDATGIIRLGLTTPLRMAPGSPPFGVLLLGMDPADELYPMLESWPTPSASGETLLIRREGDSALILSRLRRRRDAALSLRVPLSQTAVPAAQAVNGAEGILEGSDYSGIPVFAAARRVPGTPWVLVAKLDQKEVLAPIARRAVLAAIAAFSLILAAAAGVALLWRRQQAGFYRERYQAELERRALAGHYDFLSRFANDIILLIDSDGRVVEANDRALDAYGYSREELLRLTIDDLRAPSERGRLRRRWDELADGASLVFETLHARRDGGVFPVEVSARGIEVEGRLFRQGIIRDITERKAMDAELLQSQERFRKVVENAPEGIMVESGLAIRYLNPVAVTMLGAQSAAELLGRPVLDFIHPDERAQVSERLAGAAQGVAAPVAEHRILRVDGKILTVEASKASIEYDRKAAALVFFRDIAERKRSEAERAGLEAQLQQAQKMESIGRLTGGIAHDFNNYLTVINGYCEKLSGDLDGQSSIRESLDEIRAAGERAAALTRQLLAISRKQIAELAPISLNDVVADAGKMLGRLIGEDVEIDTRLDANRALVMADRGQMNQVLMNLAVNARDAMPDGGRLTIETGSAEIDAAYAALHPEARPGSYAVLSVADTGVGMSPETMRKIFEPFFTTKEMGQGTGLGLATAYGIVRQGGGWIRAQSQLGQGARFDIYLPRIAGAVPAPASSAPKAGEGRGNETVLVVEDRDDVRRLAVAILRQYGYRLLEAGSGAEALEIAAGFSEPIDLLVSDVVMPGMSGHELAARLAALRPSVKVLYISGYAAAAVITQGTLDPEAAYLAKPFTARQLTSKVREVLQVAGS